MVAPWSPLLLAAVLPFAPPAAAEEIEVHPLGEQRKLKVLYAGVEGTPRYDAFAAFLRAHFDGFAAIDVAKLDEGAAAPFDVVVADGKRLYPMDPKSPSIDQASCGIGATFSKPIVMIGAMGGDVQHHTKLDWL
jgi:hypothetical protein